MEGLMRSKSGRQSNGQKSQNIEGTNEIDSDGSHNSAASESTEAGNTIPIHNKDVAAASPEMTETNVQPPITDQPKRQDSIENNQTCNGNRTGHRSDCQLMFKAAIESDWLAAEVLLARDPTLACHELTKRGDRALHVAVAMKHKKFVQKLVEWISPSDLEILLDGHGYTACCYAAMSGAVEIADMLMKKNGNLVIVRDKNNVTPLYKAAFCRNKKMVSYFLRSTKIVYLSEEEWFDLLLVTVRNKMYDVALEILEKNRSLATMKNAEGTALHLVARQDISDVCTTNRESILCKKFFGITVALNGRKIDGEMQPDLCLLAQKLWAEIQRLEEASVLELMKNPPILHEAAKVGNVELIAMVTHSYPDLIWDTDSCGYTIFHIAVIHRQENVFRLIHQLGAMKNLIVISHDFRGNNILHLAGKIGHLNENKIVSGSALQMHRELAWFKEVESIVPPLCLETRNHEGYKPRELFTREHTTMMENSVTWMRSTADSCMLIATIMLTVTFAAAFTVPGGNNGETGLPVLLHSMWFTGFIIFVALGVFGSTLCIIMFWSITTSGFEEDHFLEILPYQLKLGLSGLFGSLLGTISALMSVYFLVFVEERAALVECVIIGVYVMLFLAISSEFYKLWLNASFLKHFIRILSLPSRYNLYSHKQELQLEL